MIDFDSDPKHRFKTNLIAFDSDPKHLIKTNLIAFDSDPNHAPIVFLRRIGAVALSFLAAFSTAPTSLPAQSLPPGIVERDTVVPGPIPLPATITLPLGKGPFPGLVLVHNATGQGDRDETTGENRPFRDIAWGLAQRGIVVLRYEKRSRTEPSWFARAGFTVFDETVQDAVAAARLLRKQVELNPKRIYVAGHGLGGIVAPRIAQTEGDLAGLILLAGATQVQVADQMEQQLNYVVTIAGADSFMVRLKLQPVRKNIARIRALTAKDSFDIQPMQGLGGTSPKYWLDLNTPDPATVLRALKLPVLAMQGGRDFEMPPAMLQGWLAAVGARKNLAVKRYPILNDIFMMSDGLPGPLDYTNPKTVDQQVLNDIA
ncbi:MAG: alpha/beta fold hydrolase, partial [Gemmatimonadaceae bacterium]